MRHDRRGISGSEGRLHTNKLLIQVLRKIPIFRGLSPTQVKTILGLCTPRAFPAGALVCRSDSPSDEMFILISGELVVSTAEGIRVATVTPVTTVGELGVISGHPRTATVEAVKNSSALVIQRAHFDYVLRDDRDLQAIVYRNIIDLLAVKLTNDNIRLRDHEMAAQRYEARISVLERELREQQQKAGLSVDMLVEKAGVDRHVLEAELDSQTRQPLPVILVVDDEPEVRALLRQALATYCVVEAANGKEALERLAAKPADLILTDLRMPVMDGFELLAAVRRQFPDLPVLAISGFLDEDDISGQGFDDFIEKPVSLARLHELVVGALARRME